ERLDSIVPTDMGKSGGKWEVAVGQVRSFILFSGLVHLPACNILLPYEESFIFFSIYCFYFPSNLPLPHLLALLERSFHKSLDLPACPSPPRHPRSRDRCCL